MSPQFSELAALSTHKVLRVLLWEHGLHGNIVRRRGYPGQAVVFFPGDPTPYDAMGLLRQRLGFSFENAAWLLRERHYALTSGASDGEAGAREGEKPFGAAAHERTSALGPLPPSDANLRRARLRPLLEAGGPLVCGPRAAALLGQLQAACGPAPGRPHGALKSLLHVLSFHRADGRLAIRWDLGAQAGGRPNSAPHFERLKEFKPLFVAPPGRLLLHVDIDSADLRALAALSGDELVIWCVQFLDGWSALRAIFIQRGLLRPDATRRAARDAILDRYGVHDRQLSTTLTAWFPRVTAWRKQLDAEAASLGSGGGIDHGGQLSSRATQRIVAEWVERACLAILDWDSVNVLPVLLLGDAVLLEVPAEGLEQGVASLRALLVSVRLQGGATVPVSLRFSAGSDWASLQEVVP